jgi:hypothetical protein
MLRILFAPLSYLRIKHKSKWVIDWVFPVAFAIASVFLVFTFGAKGAVAGPNGLVDRLLVVSSVLPGFYIAALAAIATFNKPDIDEFMPEPTPRISVEIGGHDNVIRLTRRRFLSHLFAFLCWESLAIMIACVFAAIVGKGVVSHLSPESAHLATIGFAVVLLLGFWQMVCATCLGLYYLGERLHHPTY